MKTDVKIEVNLLDPSRRDYCADVGKLYFIAGWIDSVSATAHIKNSLKNSFCCFGAFDGDELVGFFRALSDGISDAYLLDLIVHPDYRNRGVGDALTRAIVSHLKECEIDWITCIATPEAVGIYSKIGAPMKGHVPFRF